MMYAYTPHEIYLGLYGSNQTEIPLTGGWVKLNQQTNYPYNGEVNLELGLEKELRFSLSLRIPTWTKNQLVPGNLYSYLNPISEPFEIFLNGKEIYPSVKDGFVRIERIWSNGDNIKIKLPLKVSQNRCDSRVIDNIGKVAFSRGPLVYCAEEIDNDSFDEITIPRSNNVSFESQQIREGILTNTIQLESETTSLVPYFSWNNRGRGRMKVWLPVDN